MRSDTYRSSGWEPTSSFNWCHSRRHNAPLDGRNNQSIRITAPHHPLAGQTLKVVRFTSRDGELHFVVESPNGQTQMIPSSYTEADSAPPLLSPGPLIFTPASLRALITMIDSFYHTQPEDCHHASISTVRPVGSLQPRNPQTSDPPLGRSASSSSPSSPARSSKRRRR
jgi:hypothetical protein